MGLPGLLAGNIALEEIILCLEYLIIKVTLYQHVKVDANVVVFDMSAQISH